jgi:hypothetical protein
MGFSFRKSFSILPGVHVNLSKSGPSLSVGVPGARISINTRGEARFYGGAGPLHYRKSLTLGTIRKIVKQRGGVLASIQNALNRGKA